MNSIKKLFQKFKVESIVSAVFAIILGILFVAMPNSSANALCTVSGVFFIITGLTLIMAFVAGGFFFGGHLLILGIALLICGAFTLSYPNEFKDLIKIIFGIYIIVDGTTSLVDSIYCARAKIRGWFVLTIISVLSIILGSVLMLATFETIVIFMGCALIIDGICDLIEILVFSKKVREAKKGLLDSHETIYID